MKSFAKLAVAVAMTAMTVGGNVWASDAKEIEGPKFPSPVIVVLKYDADYSGFASQARDDRRLASAPHAWRYVEKGVLGAVQRMEEQHQFETKHVYSHALRGFSAMLTPSQVEALRNDPAVERVEPDGWVTTNAQSLPWGIKQIGGHLSSTVAGDGTGTVSGVHVYVIDTGIVANTAWGHPDLNVLGHVNFTDDDVNEDCNGHGTHVAGTIGAKDNSRDVVGVAPGVPLIGVKVLDCWGSGLYSDVIKGIDWVTAVSLRPSVVNMSLGGSAHTPVDEAVRRSAAKGIVYALAAGNAGGNACDYSPARSGNGPFNGIITVGATDSSDREAGFSNHGECVDVWAPGVGIESTWTTTSLATLSGTSMASPHVAGAAALLLSRAPALLPGAVELNLKSTASYPGTTSRDGRSIIRINSRFF